MTKVTIATIPGGFLMFIWGVAWHMAFSFSNHQMKVFKNEDAIMKTLRENVTESGYYFFPGMDMSGALPEDKQKAEEARFTEKYKTGPHGLLIIANEGSRTDDALAADHRIY